MFAGSAAEGLAGLGVTPGDFEDDEDVVVPWPENARAVGIFALFGSQWRTGPGGVIGWDYGPAMQYMAAQRFSPRRTNRLLSQFRVIESVALEVFREQSEAV